MHYGGSTSGNCSCPSPSVFGVPVSVCNAVDRIAYKNSKPQERCIIIWLTFKPYFRDIITFLAVTFIEYIEAYSLYFFFFVNFGSN